MALQDNQRFLVPTSFRDAFETNNFVPLLRIPLTQRNPKSGTAKSPRHKKSLSFLFSIDKLCNFVPWWHHFSPEFLVDTEPHGWSAPCARRAHHPTPQLPSYLQIPVDPCLLTSRVIVFVAQVADSALICTVSAFTVAVYSALSVRASFSGIS